jgi:hypothetical protein
MPCLETDWVVSLFDPLINYGSLHNSINFNEVVNFGTYAMGCPGAPIGIKDSSLGISAVYR